MYPVIKFQLTWRTSDFETKFGPKNMSEKKKKKKIKTHFRIEYMDKCMHSENKIL